MDARRAWVAIVALLIVGLGGWWLQRRSAHPPEPAAITTRQAPAHETEAGAVTDTWSVDDLPRARRPLAGFDADPELTSPVDDADEDGPETSGAFVKVMPEAEGVEAAPDDEAALTAAWPMAPTGLFRGVVRLSEPWRPGVRIINGSDPYCPEMRFDTFLVDEELGLANVLVEVAHPERLPPRPPQEVVLDHVACQLEPRIQCLVAGSRVRFGSPDETVHVTHVRWGGPRGRTLWVRHRDVDTAPFEETFRSAGLLHVGCDVHPWEEAYLRISAHGHCAVTDADGAFTLAGLPPGEYGLRLWHEALGTSEMWVSVTEDPEPPPQIIVLDREDMVRGLPP